MADACHTCRVWNIKEYKDVSLPPWSNRLAAVWPSDTLVSGVMDASVQRIGTQHATDH